MSPIASPPLVEARLLLATGRAGPALEVLWRGPDMARERGWTWEALRTHALLVVAVQEADATGHVRAAVELVAATGLVRAVADAGPSIAPLLARVPDVDRRSVRTVRRIRRALPPEPDVAELTPREREVLRFVAACARTARSPRCW